MKDRDKTVKFFKEAFGYSEQTVFNLKFDDGTTCECTALEPPEKTLKTLPWIEPISVILYRKDFQVDYHMAPEIFVSEGQPGSIVEKWVDERGGIGGIHHLAYLTSDIDKVVAEWKEKGIEFSGEVIDCKEEDLRQIFTKPITLMGNIIIELIERGPKNPGFCRKSVKKLMESTSNNDT